MYKQDYKAKRATVFNLKFFLYKVYCNTCVIHLLINFNDKAFIQNYFVVILYFFWYTW